MSSIKDKNLDDVLNGLFGTQHNNNDGGWKEIDLDQRLGGMIPKNLNIPIRTDDVPIDNFNFGPQQTTQISDRVVRIKEGTEHYKQLQISSPISMAIFAGPTTNVFDKEFEYCGKIKVYIVKSINETIDLSKIDRNRMKMLAIVRANFFGTILVPETAIRKNGGNGPIILKD